MWQKKKSNKFLQVYWFKHIVHPYMALMIRDKYTQLLLIFNYNLNQVSWSIASLKSVRQESGRSRAAFTIEVETYLK